MSIDLRHMLKVYNFINDEKRPKVNYKFLGLFAAFLVATGALIAFAVVNLGSDGSGGGPDGAASQTRTDYVGLSPAEIAAGSLGSNTVSERLASWQATHSRADIQSVEPVYEGGLLVGYMITYAPG